MAWIQQVHSHQRPNGTYPTNDALLECERISPKLRATVEAGIVRLQFTAYHSTELTEYISGDLWCLRIMHQGMIARIFFMFATGARIYLLNGYVSKVRTISHYQLRKARMLLREVQAYA